MGELALVNLANIPKDRVAFGSRIKVFDNTKEEEIEYKLVTSEESDVSKGLISSTSPIGKALIGKKVGDTATVVKLNVDDNPSTAQRYGIKGIPTLILFRDGKEVERVVGATSKESIMKMIEKYVAVKA